MINKVIEIETLPRTIRGVVLCLLVFAATDLVSVKPLVLGRESPQSESSNRDSWYTKYPVYPKYCSLPEDMINNRKVPPILQDSTKGLGESRLVHVTAVIRHGARTPYKGGLNCWNGYNDSSDTGVWDCDLTTFLSPPTPEKVDEEEGDTVVDAGNAMFLFEKKYDALVDPADHLSNHLMGTCQTGQLLLQGYEQELSNGKNLRDAYLYNGDNFEHDQRLRLIDVSGKDGFHVWENDNVYFRADDDQRTLMSGQVVLRGLFGAQMASYLHKFNRYPVLPVHTADRDRDIVAPNAEVCPRLAEIRSRYMQSSRYRAFDESKEANTLRAFQREVLGIQPDMDAIDCLMTTICTDRTLPDSLNDFKGEDLGRRLLLDMEESEVPRKDAANGTEDSNPSSYGTNLFQRLYDFEVKGFALPLVANDSEFSKLGMGPLWYEIMQNINGTIKEEEELCCPFRASPPKLAVFAGHDTTIMPLLASLGENVWDQTWPPYASMLLIEIHDVNIDGQTDRSIYTSDYAFRLVYNGEVITSRLDGCPDEVELCDVQVLLDRVLPFAARDLNCNVTHTTPEQYEDLWSRLKNIVSTTGGVLGFLLLIVWSAGIGGLITFFYLTGSLPKRPPQPFPTLGPNREDVALTNNERAHESDDFNVVEPNDYSTTGSTGIYS